MSTAKERHLGDLAQVPDASDAIHRKVAAWTAYVASHVNLHKAFDAFTCGGIAGSVGIMFSQPFDVMRIRMQTMGASSTEARGTFQVARNVWHTEGLRGLYRGVASPAILAGTRNACILLGYDTTLRLLGARNLLDYSIAGLVGGLVAVPVTTASELVKVQAQTAKNPGTRSLGALEWGLFRNILRTRGFPGLMSGAALTAMRDGTYRSCYFVVYEWETERLHYDHQHKPAYVSFCMGGVAGMVPWVLTYPIDVLKTHWQSGKRFGANSMFGMLRAGLRTEGPGWLTRGITPTLIRAGVMNAVVWTTYEQLREIFD